MSSTFQPIDELCINTIRTLSIDAVQKANSGHPGMPLGAAPMSYVLWSRHLRHNPTNPKWPDRDRFVLSAGHASMLLYSLLFLTGYDLTMADIQQFRRWGSRTPGHPEYGVVPGAEVTTGPLGQGIGNAVGFAIAERWLAANFNRSGHEVVNHYTYVMASDGDMMEGVAAEAASIAGQFRLGRLIVLYDSNQTTLSASTDVTFSEDVGARFRAYGWHVEHIDGMDLAAVDAALTRAKAIDDRPSLIVARTHIGYGSPHKHDTFEAHGEPLGVDEVRLTKRALGWPEDQVFYIPDEALAQFRKAVEQGRELETQWNRRVDALGAVDPEAAQTFRQVLAGELPKGWEAGLPRFTPADGAMATRDAGQKAIAALADVVPNLIGGSGDLDPSTRTALKGYGDFESPLFKPSQVTAATQGLVGGPIGYAGRNIHFGIREHAMAAIVTGMALHGGVLPFAATFFTFSDYMRPSIRLAALSKAHVIYVWDPRQHRIGRGRTYSSAGGTTGRPSGASRSDAAAPGGCQRDRGGVEDRGYAHLGAGRTCAYAPEITYSGPLNAGAGFGSGERSVCPQRLRYGFADRYPDRYRFRSVACARSAQPTDARRNSKQGSLDAVVGFVSVATAILQGHGSSSRRQGAGQHRGSLHARMGALCGPRRHYHRAESVRWVGARRDRDA
jgi:transketolase